MLLLCALVAGSLNGWAEDVTFTAGTDTGSNGSSGNSDTMNKSGITISGSSFATTTAEYRIYAGSTLTISSAIGNITKIVITSVANKGEKYGPDNLSVTGTGYSVESNSKEGVWTGSASSVSFSASAQCRAEKIVITYASTYTISEATNNVSWGTVSRSGSVITATPAEGYRISKTTPYTVSPEGSATVVQSGNEFTVTPTANTTVTINFEAIPTHNLSYTISPTDAGTVTLGATTVHEDASTTIQASPNAGYKFTGWSISGTGATVDDVEAASTSMTMGTEDATVTAIFEAVVTYPIHWSVNGAVITTENVEENTAITFPTTVDDVPAGYEFMGWSKTEVLTPQDESPEIVSSAISTKETTYFAVFALVLSTTPESWTETPLSSMTSTDVFVFSNGTYAMNNDGGTSAPTVNKITVSDGKITSTVEDKLKWQVSGNATDGYTFYPNGTKSKWLYCSTTASSSSNDNIKVGTGNRKYWIFDTTGYLKTKDDYTTRYLSIYSTQDFRSYINTTNAFVPKFYKYTAASALYGNFYTTVSSTPKAISVDSKGYTTLCANVPLDFTNATSKAYKATVEGNTVKMTKVTKVPAGEGSVIKGEAENIPVLSGEADDMSDNELVGVLVATTVEANTVSVLSTVNDVEGFYKFSGTTIPAGKAYLPVVASDGARMSIAFDEESGTTGVEEFKNSGTEELKSYYNLAGQRVAQPTKGLYIVNGKKVLVK